MAWALLNKVQQSIVKTIAITPKVQSNRAQGAMISLIETKHLPKCLCFAAPSEVCL
jgi:hypothetical protein